MKTSGDTIKKIPVGFHAGRTLLHLAGSYPRPGQVILEMVQNAIDAGSKQILIKVNQVSKTISCADDGQGESFENLQKRFQRISERQKDGKIGQKGIGNLAPLSIAEAVHITTRPSASGERFFTIILNKEGLENMADGINLTCRQEKNDFRPGSTHRLSSDFAISTLLLVKNVSKSALKSLKDTDAVVQAIEDRFAPQILSKKIRIVVDIMGRKAQVSPALFPGENVKSEYPTRYGSITFDMYISSKPVKKPRLSLIVGKTEDEKSSIPDFTQFYNLHPAIKEVFSSGLLQGNIEVPFCNLTPSRTELMQDDEFYAFWEVLELYAKTEGRKIIEQIQENNQESKTKKIIFNALFQVQKLLRDFPDDQKLFAALVTDQHFDAKKDPEFGEKMRSVKVKKRPGKVDRLVDSPSAEQKGKIHTGVVDDTGSKRRLHNKETGINVEWRYPTSEEGRGWTSKREGPLIVLNSTHKLWQEAEKDSKLHTRYCVMLIIKELILSKMENNTSAIAFAEVFDNLFLGYIIKITI